MPDRLEQLLGVTALAAMDRLRLAVVATGVDEPEAGALVHLRAWPGATVNELASVVGRSQSATVRLVDRLEADGLVARTAAADRRAVALTVTAAGAERADRALRARAEALAPLLAGLSTSTRAELETGLSEVAAAAATDRPGALHACRLCDRDVCGSGPGCPLDHTVQP